MERGLGPARKEGLAARNSGRRARNSRVGRQYLAGCAVVAHTAPVCGAGRYPALGPRQFPLRRTVKAAFTTAIRARCLAYARPRQQLGVGRGEARGEGPRERSCQTRRARSCVS